ncbi:MAG: hypothetical protein KDB79_07215 [Acidobacteria bacterium]|nr:hypothetical protein [Acidobacteriota bacterium]
MKVEFKRTGEKRYSVSIWRDDQPALIMDPAPGFDPLMPHDLLHFLVELKLELRHGIFGQIALGGTATTFSHLNTGNSKKRTGSRLRRKSAKRDKNLAKQEDDYDRSERATVICLYDWTLHSQSVELRNRAKEMEIDAESTLARMSDSERRSLSDSKLAEIRTAMDELSQNWSNLNIEESIILTWPT